MKCSGKTIIMGNTIGISHSEYDQAKTRMRESFISISRYIYLLTYINKKQESYTPDL